MKIIKSRENQVYQAVLIGELEIANDGKIWRVIARRSDRWRGGSRAIPCVRRRAENPVGGYLQVRAMFDGVRYHALHID